MAGQGLGKKCDSAEDSGEQGSTEHLRRLNSSTDDHTAQNEFPAQYLGQMNQKKLKTPNLRNSQRTEYADVALPL